MTFTSIYVPLFFVVAVVATLLLLLLLLMLHFRTADVSLLCVRQAAGFSEQNFLFWRQELHSCFGREFHFHSLRIDSSLTLYPSRFCVAFKSIMTGREMCAGSVNFSIASNQFSINQQLALRRSPYVLLVPQ